MRWVAMVSVVLATGCGSRSGLTSSSASESGGASGSGASGGTGAVAGFGGTGAFAGTGGAPGGGGSSTGGVGGGSAKTCAFAEVTTGGQHTCAREAAGTAYCWGANLFGQVGDGTAGFDRTSPTPIAGPADIVGLGSGEYHSHGVRRGTVALSWGHNPFGNLGNGNTLDSDVPVSIPLMWNVMRASRGASSYHACAIHSAGKLSCWGDNSKGQLGTGSFTSSTNAKPVVGVSDARDVAVGYIHTCMVHHDGTASCFGWNASGALGQGNTQADEVSSPQKVPGVVDAVQVVAGNHYACVRRLGGSVSCWGYNGHGQLGIGEKPIDNMPTPTPVEGLTDAVFLAGGQSHACAVRANGKVVCWGRNYFGQVGDGTTVDRGKPFEVVGISDARSVAAGGEHTCALSASRGLLCWGANGSGQIGDGTSQDRLTPVEVPCPLSTCGAVDVARIGAHFVSCGDGARVGQNESAPGVTCNDVCCTFGFAGCSHRAAQASFAACTPGSPTPTGSCDDVFQDQWSSQCVCTP